MQQAAVEEIGKAFIGQYYGIFDTCTTNEDRAMKIYQFYHPQALFQFEDAKFQGRDNIAEKIKSLSFGRVQHAITKADFQPTTDGGLLILVTGQLKADDDHPLGFSHVFQLKPENDSFFIMHEIFRLSLHNFPGT